MKSTLAIIFTTLFSVLLSAQVPNKIELRLRTISPIYRVSLPCEFLYKHGITDNSWLRLRVGYVQVYYTSPYTNELQFNIGLGWERQTSFSKRWAIIYGVEPAYYYKTSNFRSYKNDDFKDRQTIIAIGIPLSIQYTVTDKLDIAFNIIPAYYYHQTFYHHTYENGLNINNIYKGVSLKKVNGLGLSFSYKISKD